MNSGRSAWSGTQPDERQHLRAHGDEPRARDPGRLPRFTKRVAERRKRILEPQLLEGLVTLSLSKHIITLSLSKHIVTLSLSKGRVLDHRALRPTGFAGVPAKAGSVRAFLGGFAAAIIVVVLLVFGAIETGAVPARADGGLLPGEHWAANTSLNATIEREAPKPPYPAYATNADITDGARLYVQNCSVCHGTAHTTANAIARGLGVRPPQFAKHDVNDDPESETYWKIAHGIRFTGHARVRAHDE